MLVCLFNALQLYSVIYIINDINKQERFTYHHVIITAQRPKPPSSRLFLCFSIFIISLTFFMFSNSKMFRYVLKVTMKVVITISGASVVLNVWAWQ